MVELGEDTIHPHITDWCWMQRTGSATSKLVLACASLACEPDGRCLADYPAMVHMTGLHKRTVQRHLVRLQDAGYLSFERGTHPHIQLNLSFGIQGPREPNVHDRSRQASV